MTKVKEGLPLPLRSIRSLDLEVESSKEHQVLNIEFKTCTVYGDNLFSYFRGYRKGYSNREHTYQRQFIGKAFF